MTTNDPNTPEERALTAILRWKANLLRLSHFCARSACRRTGTCGGDPRDCITRFAPLIPDDVRGGIDALVDANFEGLSYDEVRQAAPAEVAAYEGWLGKVRESAQLSAAP